MRKFSKKERLYIYEFSADMINAGLPLYNSIQKLQEEGEKLLGAGFRKKLERLLEKMTASESISVVFEGLIPQEELGIIYSSEKSGSLADGFSSLVDNIRYRGMLMSSLIGAVTFPLIMMVLSLVVIAGYAVKVFPAFEKVINVSRWPGVTQALYGFGSALYNGLWVTILIAVVAGVFLLRFMMTHLSGSIRDRMLDRIIPFSVYKKLTSALILSNLSSMLRNNIPINDALDIIMLNSNRWLKSHVAKMQLNMSVGMPYGSALNTGLLGNEELLNISLYSSLPSFFDVLQSVSEKARVDIQVNIKKLSALLKSLSTLVLGGSVIWVFIALFALSDALSKMTSY